LPYNHLHMQNNKLSRLAETLIGSEIVKLGGIIKEKIKQGEHIYNYTIGDFDSKEFPIPVELKEAIQHAFDEGYTTYPIANGEEDLRLAVSNFIETHQAVKFAPNEILIGAGGRPLIYALYRALVDKGEKVVYPVPSWNNNHYAHFTDAEHVLIETTKENNFLPTVAQIKDKIKGATLLALCSPLNPTGTAFTKEALLQICEAVVEENNSRAAGEKKLYFMFDQMYWTLTFGSCEHYNPLALCPAVKPYTIFIDGISKAFASTGVRVGWSLGPADIIAKMKAINSHVGAWAPMAEQKAVAAYLKQTEKVQQYLQHITSEVYFRLKSIYDGFLNLKAKGYAVNAIEPQAAIYLTVQINAVGKKHNGAILQNQPAVTQFILDNAKLAMVPFSAFGDSADSSWYRISVGCVKRNEINEMLQKLEAALALLQD
jgi:aspartate aminotransferase